MASAPKRRWYQFSLLTMLVVLTLTSVPLGYIAWEREECRRGTSICAQITKLGGLMESRPTRRAWLQRILGNNDFRQVYIVSLENLNVGDADLAELPALCELRTVWLDNTQVTDVGLASLSHLKNLRELSLGNTKLTDAGLIHLASLTSLERLDLSGTQATGDGVNELQRRLPNLVITR